MDIDKEKIRKISERKKGRKGEIERLKIRIDRGKPGSISPTFYAQLLLLLIPKA